MSSFSEDLPFSTVSIRNLAGLETADSVAPLFPHWASRGGSIRLPCSLVLSRNLCLYVKEYSSGRKATYCSYFPVKIVFFKWKFRETWISKVWMLKLHACAYFSLNINYNPQRHFEKKSDCMFIIKLILYRILTFQIKSVLR